MKFSRARSAESDTAHTYTNRANASFLFGFTADQGGLLRNAALVTAYGTWSVDVARLNTRSIGMEEKESEPGVQTESLSLIIRDEGEEATPPYGASAQLAAGKHGRVHNQSAETDRRAVRVCRVNPADEQ